MSEVLLECDGIVKLFPGVRALDGVALRLTAGSVHALLGENGAGKSTLIKVLTGVHAPDGGRLTWCGKEIQLRSPLEATRTGIGVVHQERNLIPGFSVAENITLQNPPSRRGLVDREAMTAPAQRCLAELGLDIDPHRPVQELSVAQQQLVEIAKALYTESRVLLLDEPTASLSPRRQSVSSTSSGGSPNAARAWCSSATSWRRSSPSVTPSPSCGTAGQCWSPHRWRHTPRMTW